jgi:hypothetical protein
MGLAASLATPVGFGITILVVLTVVVARRVSRLSRLEAKIDALLLNAGIAVTDQQDDRAEPDENVEQGCVGLGAESPEMAQHEPETIVRLH